MMKLKVLGLFAILFVAAVLALSQHVPPEQPQHPAQPHAPQPAQPPHPPGPDPFGQNLFPPEMVMQHRQALGLTDEQKNGIREELLKASTRFTELQWQMQDEMETMVGLTKGPAVDEQRVLSQLDKILTIEREVKRTQLSLSIRIKNKLTPEQQTRLQELRHRPPQQ
jgi:Spy/CpxP family protein refolding chaperone